MAENKNAQQVREITDNGGVIIHGTPSLILLTTMR